MEGLHVQDNGIGNTIDSISLQDPHSVNDIVCSWYDIYFSLEHSWWLVIPQLNYNHKIMKQYSLYSQHLITWLVATQIKIKLRTNY
jgi:hypothetical protein